MFPHACFGKSCLYWINLSCYYHGVTLLHSSSAPSIAQAHLSPGEWMLSRWAADSPVSFLVWSQIMLLTDPEVESSLLISLDEGASYQKHSLAFDILSLLFHPEQEDWILAYSHDQKVTCQIAGKQIENLTEKKTCLVGSKACFVYSFASYHACVLPDYKSQACWVTTNLTSL